jgi:Gpi18-like mannosyltransferase
MKSEVIPNVKQKYLLLFFSIFILYLFIMPKTGHKWDILCWQNWAIYIFKHGLRNVYDSDTNYLPIYQYILWFFVKIQGSEQAIIDHIYYLKVISLLFDFFTGFLLIKIIHEKFKNIEQSLFMSLFYFVNIFIFYNSVIWGQVDGIVTSFVFLSFFFAIKENKILALILLVISINMKLQAIIFLPFIGLIILPQFLNEFKIKTILIGIFSMLACQFLILFPFILNGSVEKVWAVVTDSMGRFPVVSLSASNLWHLLTNKAPYSIQNTEIFIVFSYKTIGYFLFFTFSFLALFPLTQATFHSLKNKSKMNISLEKLLLIGALIPLLFFYLNTQMLERYSHPALIFLIAYCIIKENFWLGFLGCFAYFSNLECVLKHFEFSNYEALPFNPKFTAVLFSLTILALFDKLYEFGIQERMQTEFNKIKSIIKI